MSELQAEVSRLTTELAGLVRAAMPLIGHAEAASAGQAALAENRLAQDRIRERLARLHEQILAARGR